MATTVIAAKVITVVEVTMTGMADTATIMMMATAVTSTITTGTDR